jgi:thioesterase domain-containing protein/acyl carrier protein
VGLSTPTERTLAALWGELLKTSVAGAEDNFLDLGGHSLLAIEMLTRVNDEFHVELALRHAFEAPTVRELAIRIDAAKRGTAATGKGANGAARLSVPIQPGDGRPALFCVAPAGGTTFPYYALAHHLGAEQGVYCLQDPAFDGTRPPLKRIHDMAREYIAAMRAVRPEGPYHVAGWSFGGVVAYEIARLLGGEAGVVALIEAFAPESRRAFRLADVPANIGFAVRVAGSGIQTTRDSLFLMSSPRNGDGGLRRVWSNALYRLYLDRAQMAGVVAQNEELLGIDQPSTRRFLTIARANLKAGKSYAPGPYGGDVHVFKASEQPRATAMSDALGWERHVPSGRVHVHTIQGDHFCILRNPHVAKLAAVISRELLEYDHGVALESAPG